MLGYAKLNDSSSHGGTHQGIEEDSEEKDVPTIEKLPATYCIVDDDDDEDCTATVDESRDESIWSSVAREERENESSSSSMKEEMNGTTVVVIQELQESSILHDNSSGQERLIVLLKQSLPVIAAFFFQYAGTFTSLLFASHYTNSVDGSMVFAGVSLANMFVNVTCLSLLVGMSAGIETLASQYNGAQQYTGD